jgi:hypothetical protein|tara:strand:- start:208 stop:408 length:201 start_codon:yes stop_codon:yes gene_type:complete
MELYKWAVHFMMPVVEIVAMIGRPQLSRFHTTLKQVVQGVEAMIGLVMLINPLSRRLTKFISDAQV